MILQWWRRRRRNRRRFWRNMKCYNFITLSLYLLCSGFVCADITISAVTFLLSRITFSGNAVLSFTLLPYGRMSILFYAYVLCACWLNIPTLLSTYESTDIPSKPGTATIILFLVEFIFVFISCSYFYLRMRIGAAFILKFHTVFWPITCGR